MAEIIYTLNIESTPEYTIDIGTTGTRGKGATVTVGTTTTLHSGSTASVDNSGTTADGIFNFSIPKGSTWYNGTGVPSSTLGMEGDYYLDVEQSKYYNKINSTDWSQIGAIAGTNIWGNITGTLSNQTDLQNALDAKIDSTTFNSYTTSATSTTSTLSTQLTNHTTTVATTTTLGHIKPDGNTLTTSTTGVTQLTTTGITAGTYNSPNITIDNYGRITSASSGTSSQLTPNTINGGVTSAGNPNILSYSGNVITLASATKYTDYLKNTSTTASALTVTIPSVSSTTFNLFIESGALAVYTNTIYKQKTAPSSPSNNDVWYDISQEIPIQKKYSTSSTSWVTYTGVYCGQAITNSSSAVSSIVQPDFNQNGYNVNSKTQGLGILDYNNTIQISQITSGQSYTVPCDGFMLWNMGSGAQYQEMRATVGGTSFAYSIMYCSAPNSSWSAGVSCPVSKGQVIYFTYTFATWYSLCLIPRKGVY